MKIRLSNNEIKFLILIFILGLLFRLALISNNYIHFYFDQARDAYISRTIIEKGDLKIFGPSASGSNDTIFHGVLYYYVIGPLYTISGGNPLFVVFLLSLLNSTTTIPIYLLGKNLSGKKEVGIFASLLYAFSIDAAILSSSLSNPSLATVTIPWFFYFTWKAFFMRNYKYLPLVALFLGISNQFIIYSIYLYISIIIFYLFTSFSRKRKYKLNIKPVINSIFIYLFSVSTILLAQFKLFKAGIFDPRTIFTQVQNKMEFMPTVLGIINLYIKKVYYVFPVISSFLSTIIFITIFTWLLFINRNKNQKIFLVVWILGPFLLLLVLFRDSLHNFVGIIPAIYILFSLFVFSISKKMSSKYIALIIMIIFIALNTKELLNIRILESNYLSVQKGAFLNEQLKLIDQTYLSAKEKDFSISALTAPHGYSTTWSYLYSWYGLKENGYTPLWFGPLQEGIPAGTLLSQTKLPLDNHFTIYEPNPGTLEIHRNEFQEQQNDLAGNTKKNFQFGSLFLEER